MRKKCSTSQCSAVGADEAVNCALLISANRPDVDEIISLCRWAPAGVDCWRGNGAVLLKLCQRGFICYFSSAASGKRHSDILTFTESLLRAILMRDLQQENNNHIEEENTEAYIKQTEKHPIIIMFTSSSGSIDQISYDYLKRPFRWFHLITQWLSPEGH